MSGRHQKGTYQMVHLYYRLMQEVLTGTGWSLADSIYAEQNFVAAIYEGQISVIANLMALISA